MRVAFAVGLLAILYPAVVPAQTARPAAQDSTAAPRSRGGRDITRDEYVERAKRNAERRFDRMDTNHDGVLTIDERRAARGRRRGSAPEDPSQ